MIKFFGASLIVAAFSVWGGWVGRGIKRRMRLLDDLIDGIGVLETEIAFAAQDLASAFERMAQQSDNRCRPLFLGLAHRIGEGDSPESAMEQALREWNEGPWLGERAQAVLRRFASVLGASDCEDQRRHLHATREYLKALRQSADAQEMEKVRLYRYVGVAAGCVIVILLY